MVGILSLYMLLVYQEGSSLVGVASLSYALWVILAGLGTVLFLREFGKAFTIINIYGSYQQKVFYWKKMVYI